MSLVESFLCDVHGTEVFGTFCRQRHIAFGQRGSSSMRQTGARVWRGALAQLTEEEQGRVSRELERVIAMGATSGTSHLVEAAAGTTYPPDSVPDGTPLALWFFLHHPGLFHEVFLHHEAQDAEPWYTAWAAAGLSISDPQHSARSLGQALRRFFRTHLGTGRFCTVQPYRLPEAIGFSARIADRIHVFDGFTDSGKSARYRLRPALPVLFVYYPKDGTVLLQSPLHSIDLIREMARRFGRAVLGSSVTFSGASFDLEQLKYPFHASPDAADMEMVRVKTLHLRYPERAGRPTLKLETLSSDKPSAIQDLLRAHVDGGTLADLRVSHAELQVRLRIESGSVNSFIRLWANRCTLGPTPLGERLRACLRRWGLCHER